MPFITRGIIENVGEKYIKQFLEKNNIGGEKNENGLPIAEWINELLSNNKIEIDNFEKFLFNELFLGKRKQIRVYQIGNIRKIKYPQDWESKYRSAFKLNKMDFNDILNSMVNPNETCKIVATEFETNEKGELVQLKILFMHYIQLNEDNGTSDSYSYIPLDVDFNNKIMRLKVWNRTGVNEKYRAENLLNNVFKIINCVFDVEIKEFRIEHKEVLYNVSKGLVDDVYKKISAFNKIDEFQDGISEFEQKVFNNLPIINVKEDSIGKKFIPKGVMEFSDEIRKAIERLSINDYFYKRNFNEVWEMGIEAIIARIKFNDNENVLTSLKGEDSEKPIFCTKTFMYLKKSMEDSKLVERLWVVKNRSRGRLIIGYDATVEEYLEIRINYGIRYNEEDLNSAMEMYKSYENGTHEETSNENRRNVC